VRGRRVRRLLGEEFDSFGTDIAESGERVGVIVGLISDSARWPSSSAGS
jgi:hypothetical protein